ncbi:hypothetical protein BD311DRAFT_532998 [Dichomitus squalens]|uniref:Uncharacterized protein n=1 Tax=Dichomitus squalens TaxID=114155 RepID=A0A4Q9MG56_9APHY|nr:hypothetical protein BD311DRAFT_532998 [Dichomitus squalens]
MSLSLALSLTPGMSGTIRGLMVLIETTLERDAACHTLEAQCANIQAQVDAARAHILQEKATQKRLRAEIATFLKERGEARSANSSRVIGSEDVSVIISPPGTDDVTPDASTSALSCYMQDSPLVLRAKRRGSSIITPDRIDVLVKRRRLAGRVSPRKPTLLERLSSPRLQ